MLPINDCDHTLIFKPEPDSLSYGKQLNHMSKPQKPHIIFTE
jgi:hypothetical protein